MSFKNSLTAQALVKSGSITEKQLLDCIQQAKKQSLIDYAAQTYQLKETKFAKIAANITQSSYIDAKQNDLEQATTANCWLQLECLSNPDKDNGMKIICADPDMLTHIKEYAQQNKEKISIYLTEYSALKKILWQHRCKNLFQKINKILTNNPEDAKTKQQLQQPNIAKEIINHIVAYAIWQNASDIHIEAGQHNAQVRCRIDGKLQKVLLYPSIWHAPIVSRLKLLAQCDITETRLPQDGRLLLAADQTRAGRFSSCPAFYGEKIVLRLLQQAAQSIPLHKLGLQHKQHKKLKAALQKDQGLILVTGPTGSGKSMTLYSAMSEWDKTDKNICSVEDPVEIPMPDINQIAVQSNIGLDFARVLRSLLRQDPDIIIVGEIRDPDTARIALQAAHTGHLVLATLHTHTPEASIQRLMDLGVPPYMLHCIQFIIAQRLLRLLCPYCKIAQTAAEHADKTPPHVFSANNSGCMRCHKGYSGRTGIFICLDKDNIQQKLRNPNATISCVDDIDLQKSAQLHHANGLVAASSISSIDCGHYLQQQTSTTNSNPATQSI